MKPRDRTAATSGPPRGGHARLRRALAISFCGVVGLGALASPLGAQSIDDLNSRISGARSQAQSMAADVNQKAAQVEAARSQAAAAAQREAQLSAVLARGEQREAELAGQVRQSRTTLRTARAHLHRALGALADRLVAIYKGDAPDATELLLDSKGFNDLANRADLLHRIQQADTELAVRVRRLRNQVSTQLDSFQEAKAQAVAFNQRVATARDQIASVRARAEAQAAALEQARQQESTAAAGLQSQISGWEDQVQAAEAAQAQQASQAQAQQTVAGWVGQWAIPQAIVMCESGGNFGAVNPSSGAGGAYQILPSTWRLYGGSGSPQDASPSEQSHVAAQIWADSGPGAWECAQ
jgi:peptidoglycan hydrolase CwlO-like protein